MTTTALRSTDLPLELVRRGKVRDVYAVDADRLLIVATDRVSAFDVVMREAIPRKGAVLTQLTAWWLRQLGDIVEHHMIASDVDTISAAAPRLAGYRELLHQRAMLVWRTTVFPIECVVRGYIAGSAWKEYRQHGTLAGEPLPAGLTESARLDPPIFSPASKAETGHDENITKRDVAAAVGDDVARELEHLSQRIYARGRDRAAERGIIVADTKFEFGERDGRILLIDEVLTPDSSRFWPADRYQAGRAQESFDKQPLRDYLEREKGWGLAAADPAPGSRRRDERAVSRRVSAHHRIGADVSFAREGYVFIGIAAIVAIAAFVAALAMRSWALWLLAFALALLALWVPYFFRDPERAGERGEKVVVAPADGRLQAIADVDEPTFVHGRATRISIFMNVFDVHVNRYPISGTVVYRHYNPGKFLNAAMEKASLENEQSSIGIESTGGRYRLLVRQIAGLIARRIVTYGAVGDQVEQGARLGIIRFGSRVDVFVPLGSTVKVKIGQTITAGTTVLAELP